LLDKLTSVLPLAKVFTPLAATAGTAPSTAIAALPQIKPRLDNEFINLSQTTFLL